MEDLDLGLGISAAGAVESERATRSLIGTLKDYVSNLFGFKDATEEADQRFTNHIGNVRSSEQIYEEVAGKMRTLRNALLTFAGVYGAQDIFRRAIDEGKELEELYTRLANRFGNPVFARELTQWVVEQEARLPVAREELQSIIETLDNFAIPPQMINLEGVLNAALGPAGDLNSAMSSIVSLAESGDVIPFMEAFAGRVTPQEINTALSGAVTIQERIVALTDLLDQEFQGNIQRQQATVDGQLNLITGIFNLFKEAFVGDPQAAGTFFGEWRIFIQSFTNWFLEREEDIIRFGRELGQFFGQVFRLFRQNFLALGDLADRMFITLRTFIDNSRELVNPFVLFLAIIIDRVQTFFQGFREGFVAFFQFLGRTITQVTDAFQFLFEELFGLDIRNELSGLRGLLVAIFDSELFLNAGRAVGFFVGGWLTFLALTAAIGKLAAMIKGVGSAIAFIGSMFVVHPILASIVGITLAGVALWEAWQNNMFNFRDRVAPVLDWLTDTFDSIRNVTVGLWRDLTTEIGGFIRSIRPQVSAILEFMRPIAEFLGGVLVDQLIASGRTVASVVGNVLVASFELLKSVVQGTWDVFKGGIQLIVNLLTGNLPEALDGFNGMMDGFTAIFKDTFSIVFDLIKSLGGNVFGWFIGALDRFVLGPLGKLGRFIGLDVGDLTLGSGGDTSGGEGGLANSDIVIEPQFNQPGFAPVTADRTSRTQADNRVITFNIQQQPGESAENVARRVVEEMERNKRRLQERQE